MGDEVVFYSVGVVYLSACAPVETGGETVASQANIEHPTGVTPWAVADEAFRTGEPNPCACDSEAGRRHWLLSC